MTSRFIALIGILTFLVSFIIFAQPGSALAALTLNQFIGFETGGLEEAHAINDTPVVVTSPVKHGDYALELNADGDDYRFYMITGGSTDASNDFILGFYLRFTATPTVDDKSLLEAREAPGKEIFQLEFNTARKFRIKDAAGTLIATGSTVLSVDTYYLIEILFQHSATGNFDLHIDGVSEFSETSMDLIDDTGIDHDISGYRFSGLDAGTVYVDDIYCYSGASSVSDFLGEHEIFRYQPSETNSATPDVGNDLDQGVWQDLGETPVSSDGTEPGYTTDATAQSGVMYTDGTLSGNNFRPGPNGDSEIDGDSNIKGGKWFARLKRGNGSGTEHYLKYGNDVDSISTTSDLLLSASFENHFIISTAAGVVPLSTEHFAIGMADEAAGARDMFAEEMFGFILHIPAVGGTRRIFSIQ